MERGVFLEINASITVGIDLGHHPLDLVGGGRSKDAEDISQLCQRYLPIAVGVDPLEDLFDLGHVLVVVAHRGVEDCVVWLVWICCGFDLKRENEGGREALLKGG